MMKKRADVVFEILGSTIDGLLPLRIVRLRYSLRHSLRIIRQYSGKNLKIHMDCLFVRVQAQFILVTLACNLRLCTCLD